MPRTLAYLDEVSSTALQQFNTFVARRAAADGCATLTDDWLLEQLRREWCTSASAAETAPHWAYATSPVPADPTLDNPALAGRDRGHEGWALADFVARPEAVHAALSTPEVLALRLHTGKGFRHVNASCRAADGRFALTAFVVSTALGKLGRCAKTAPPELYRGLSGRLHRAFLELYSRADGSVSASALGCLADGAPLSTTTDLGVAADAYGGEVLLVLTPGGAEFESAVPELAAKGFEQVFAPGPVRWVSQFPAEEEHMWPCHTALVPKPFAGRATRGGATAARAGKTVVVASPRYLWDAVHGCVGRWAGISPEDADFVEGTCRAAARGLGIQYLTMAVPMLLVEREVDRDWASAGDAVLAAFSVFDVEDKGACTLAAALELVAFFYREVLRAPPAVVEERVARVAPELAALCEPPGEVISWERFRDHFVACPLAKF